MTRVPGPGTPCSLQLPIFFQRQSHRSFPSATQGAGDVALTPNVFTEVDSSRRDHDAAPILDLPTNPPGEGQDDLALRRLVPGEVEIAGRVDVLEALDRNVLSNCKLASHQKNVVLDFYFLNLDFCHLKAKPF